MFPTLVLAAGLSTPAEPIPEPRPDHRSHDSGAFFGGGAAFGETTGGPATSIALMHRVGYLELGAEMNAAVLLSAMVGGGGLCGVHFGDDLSLRLLLAGGVHGYEGVGRGILSDDPGVDGSSPYLGGRALFGYALGRERRTFLGLSASLYEDLERERKAVTYMQENWLFGGDPSETTSEHTVGQTTWVATFVYGYQFDLFRGY